MTPEQYARIKELFQRARQLDSEDVGAFLSAQDVDPELRAEVEALLEQDRKQDNPVDASALGAGFAPSEIALETGCAESMPEWIGGYRILGVLGRGGMGIVYRAEQDNPKREVALKVIRTQAATADRLQLLEREAETMARLQHKGIAQVYEAGVTESEHGKQPFFVMELIDGRSLDLYAREKQLSLRGRIEVLISVCEAVQHAHQKGIVHRDLKPDNVLVTEAGAPKILDFGIARTLDTDTRRATLQATKKELIGTLLYMSPEQLSGDPKRVDTVSDVYALGVIAYELIADRQPHELGDRSLPDTIKTLSEHEPTMLGSLDKAWRGDLEVIVHKALAKDVHERYVLANELKMDFLRYLNNEPIGARPPSATYQLRKFARRNPALVASFVALFVLLVSGITVTSLLTIEANALRVEATESAAGEKSERERAESMTAVVAFESGRLSAQRAHWEEALKHYAKAEAHGYPDAVELVIGSVEAWEGSLNTPRALMEMKRLQSMEIPKAHSAKVLVLEADLFVNRLFDPYAKLDLVRRALASAASDPEVVLSPADTAYAESLLAKTGAEALACLKRARLADSLHRRANEAYANVLFATGQLQKAQEYVRVFKNLYPHDPATIMYAALVLALNGGDKDEVAELSLIAHDKLSLSQQTWLPLMLETAAFLRGFNKLQVEELLAAKDKPAFDG